MGIEKQPLVFTNDLCIGCNKCISACSCMGSTAVLAYLTK